MAVLILILLLPMNWFSHPTAAERYAAGRPEFHPAILDRIIEAFGPPPFRRALDVGCGTGQSSRALLRIADRVAAIDVSAPMLKRRGRAEGVEYARGAAESLPFASRAFDAVTAGLAFHWFPRERFLAEAGRVLVEGGWLLLYNHWFLGRMAESPDFGDWFRGEYLTALPGPPRDLSPVAAGAASSAGLSRIRRAVFEHEWKLTRAELVAHLVSQTNVIAAVEGGRTPIDEVRERLSRGLEPFFADERGTFVFAASIQAFRRR